MKYLAILGYDCGCGFEANYGFVKTIIFYATNKDQLNKRFEAIKKRKSRSNEGFQCRRNIPIEVLVLDSEFNLILSHNRKS